MILRRRVLSHSRKPTWNRSWTLKPPMQKWNSPHFRAIADDQKEFEGLGRSMFALSSALQEMF